MKGLARISLIGIMLAALAAGGCTGGDRDYFPLTPGLKWTYETQTTENKVLPDILGDAGGAQISKTTEIREVLPEETMDGQKVIPVKINAQFEHDINKRIHFVIYYAWDDNGIYPLAQKFNENIEKMPQVYVIKFPLKDGLSWQDKGKEMNIDSKLEVLAEPVSTRAGSFKNCIRIHKKGTNYPNFFSFIGYFTPGIGLIKYETISVKKGIKRETKGELVNFSR